MLNLVYLILCESKSLHPVRTSFHIKSRAPWFTFCSAIGQYLTMTSLIYKILVYLAFYYMPHNNVELAIVGVVWLF